MGDSQDTRPPDAAPEPESDGEGAQQDAQRAPATPPSLPVGARCGRHPESDAQALCVRCGNYMCSVCSSAGRSPICVDCHARGVGRFPFTRTNYSLDGLINHCIARFKEHWVTLVVATLIFLGITYGFAFTVTILATVLGSIMGEQAGSLVSGVQMTGQVLQMVLQFWIQLGLIALLIDTLNGKEPELGRLFSQTRRLPAAILQLLIIYGLIALYAGAVWGVAVAVADEGQAFSWIAIGVGAALGIIPVAYIGLGLTFAMVALVDGPGMTAIAAMTRSFQVARGKRLSIFGILMVSGLISMAGLLVCCVGGLASIPLGMMIYTALYMALANDGSPTPA